MVNWYASTLVRTYSALKMMHISKRTLLSLTLSGTKKVLTH